MSTYTIGSDPGDDYASWTAFNTAVPSPAAGSIISFRKGDTFRETVTVAASGSDGSPITYTAHGTGADPIIKGSELVTTWTAASSFQDIWTAASQAGNSSWQYDSANATKNYRVHIQNAYITASATTIRLKFKGHDTTSFTMSDAAIGPKGDGAGEDVFDYEGNAAGTNIQKGASDSFEITTGTSIYTDGLVFTIDSETDYLVAMNVPNPHKRAMLIHATVHQTYHKTTGDDETETGDVATYVSPWKNIPHLEAIQGYLPSATIWQATVTTEPKQVYFDGVRGTVKASAEACTSARDWYWAGNVLYVYHTQDPDGDIVIEAALRDRGINGANRAYITVDGIDIHYTNVDAILVTGSAGNHNNWTVTNVDIVGGTPGLDIKTSDSSVVSNVTATGCDGPGFLIYGCTNTTFTSCTASNSTATVYPGTGTGFQLVDANAGLTFTSCTADGNYQEGFAIAGSTESTTFISCTASSNGEDGFSTFDTANDIDFYYCYATLNGTRMSAVLPSYGDGYTTHEFSYDCNFYYCIAYKNYLSGWACGLDSSGKIYNCAAVDNGNTINGQDPGRAGFNINPDEVDPGGNTWEVKNCISYNNDPKHLGCTEWSYANVDFDNNQYFRTGDDGDSVTFANITAGVEPEISWNTHHTTNSKEPHSHFGDPLMTDPANGDFTLQFGSRCINRGISVGLYLDYLGLPVPIGHRPDIGAYEHKNGSNAIW